MCVNEIWIHESWIIPIVVITIFATTGGVMCLFTVIFSRKYKKKKDSNEFWKDSNRCISVLSRCKRCKHRNVCLHKERFNEYKDMIEIFEKHLKENYEVDDNFVSGVVCKDYDVDLLASWED